MGQPLAVKIGGNFAGNGGVEEDEAFAVVESGVGDHLVDVGLRNSVRETLPLGVDHTRNLVAAADEDVGARAMAVPDTVLPSRHGPSA